VDADTPDVLVWIKKDALPDNEGAAVEVALDTASITTLQDMKDACESVAHCVGFAYRPQGNIFFPKEAGTGFDPTIATYGQKHPDETWEWYYMPNRA